MSSPVKLKVFFEKYSSSSKEQFLTTFPHPFFLFEGDLPKEVQVQEEKPAPSLPGVQSIGSTRRMSALLTDEEPPFTPVNPEKSYLFSLKKKDPTQPFPVLVGRNESCDVLLAFEEISGRHLGITWTGEPPSYTITDFGSTNGTFLNTYPLDPNSPQKLTDQDVIKVGNDSFLFYSPQSLYLYACSPLW